MKIFKKLHTINYTGSGERLYKLIEKLYPICRSITGNGTRETLSILSKIIPLEIYEVPSGTKVYDWEVPLEWNVNDAWVKNSNGEKIIDFRRHNLHLLNYSTPINKTVTLAELKNHLYSIVKYPSWIPYRTSYYNRTWGFCVTHDQLLSLEEDSYQVKIDTSLSTGSLTYGELYIKGSIPDEVLISCHICHPSLCNDNLSGIAVATELATCLLDIDTKFSYRFLFIPATIGSITWLFLNESKVHNIKHGLVLALLGDNSNFQYKKSRRGDAEIDRIVQKVLSSCGEKHNILEYDPYGYDERQFCSPGFNLPIGRLTRNQQGTFPQYHTSADNLKFVRPTRLAESLKLLLAIITEIEGIQSYINLQLMGEPQLGKKGLFKKIGGQSDREYYQMAVLWVLNLSDGNHSLDFIAERSGLDINIIKKAVNSLIDVELLKENHN